MKKILIVVHRFWPYPGGAERHFFEVARRLARHGFKVDVFTTDAWDIEYFHLPWKRNWPIEWEEIEGIRVRRFRVKHFRGQHQVLRLATVLPFRYLRQVAGSPGVLLPAYWWEMVWSTDRYDAVIAGVFPHNFLMYPALRFARRRKIPFICMPLIHLGEPFRHHRWDGLLDILFEADAIITNTQQENDFLEASGIPETRIHLAGAGINPDEIVGEPDRFTRQYRIEAPFVLQLSTQTHDKGSHHLVEAMKILWEKNIPVKLVMMGQIMEDFDDYFSRQPLTVYENTIILEDVKEQTKNDALAACQLLAMMSRCDSFGIAFLEAWVAGKPVLGGMAGGVLRLVADGEDGYLVPFGDYHMAAEYIERLLGDAELRRRMGQKGRAKALRDYTWDSRFAKFLRAVEELI